MRKHLTIISIISIFIWTVIGCSQGALSTNWGSNSDQGGMNSSYRYQSAALSILETNCASCHTPTSGPVNVFGFNDVNHMVSAGLVIPGNPSQSAIYSAVVGGTMPPSGALSSSDQQIISAWIVEIGSVSPNPAPAPTPNPQPTPTPAPAPAPADPNATFTYIEKNILGISCSRCHGFNTYNSVMSIVSAGSPNSSSLYTEVSSGNMPKNSSPMTSSQIKIIYDWIAAGAPNN